MAKQIIVKRNEGSIQDAQVHQKMIFLMAEDMSNAEYGEYASQ